MYYFELLHLHLPQNEAWEEAGGGLMVPEAELSTLFARAVLVAYADNNNSFILYHYQNILAAVLRIYSD